MNVHILFKNTEANKLGMPLPAGIMRLYKRDSKGAEQFIGEDRIERTPKDEEVELKIGKAFDIVVERKQTAYIQRSTSLYETEWEIALRNRKEEPIAVTIVEPMRGNWHILSSSHEWTKKDAFTIAFTVDVKPDEEVKVLYRIQVGLP